MWNKLLSSSHSFIPTFPPTQQQRAHKTLRYCSSIISNGKAGKRVLEKEGAFCSFPSLSFFSHHPTTHSCSFSSFATIYIYAYLNEPGK